MSTPAAAVKVTLDKAKAESDAESFSQALRNAILPVVDLGDLARSAYDAVTFALEASIGAAIEAEVAEQRLVSALRERGVAVEGVTERLGSYNAALSLSTGIGDETLMGIEATLAALGAQTSQIEVLTTATLGWAEITGKDFNAAARDVAKIADGNFTALTKYGLSAETAAEAIALLTDKSAIFSDRAETTSGRIDKLTNNLGELAESFGMIATGKGGETLGWFDRLLVRVDDVTVGYGSYIGKLQEAWTESDSLAETNERLSKVMGEFADRSARGEDLGDWIGLMERMGQETKTAADETARLAREAKLLAEESSFVSLMRGRLGSTSKAEIEDRIGRSRNSGLTPEQEAAARKAQEEREIAAIKQRGGFMSYLDDSLKTDQILDLRAHISRRQIASSLGAAGKTGKDASEVAEQAFGSVVTAVGQSLVALGTAGLSAALLGTAAPWLFGITGGPTAVVLSLAAIGVGTGMIGGGGYLSASSPSAPAPKRQNFGSPRTEADNQSFGSRDAGPVSSTFIVQIDGGIWGMDAPRALRDLLERDERLVPARPGGRW